MPQRAVAEADAQQILRTQWEAGLGYFGLPIDPIWIARSLGIEVYIADLDPGTSGVLLRDQDSGIPQIYLSRDDAIVRQRFTCSHEIGHFYDRLRRNALDYGFIDNRHTLGPRGTDPQEIYANQFGAALLMPSEFVRRKAAEGLTLSQLAATFEVSYDAMRIRLDVLGISVAR